MIRPMAPVPQHLKRFWARVIGGRTGHLDGGADCGAEFTLRCGLSVGLKETLQYL